MADTNTTDVRTVTAKTAAEDAELWAAVARGECEVTATLENNVHATILSCGEVIKSPYSMTVEVWAQLKKAKGSMRLSADYPLTVRRVQPAQPAGDDGRLYAEVPNANELSERELGRLFVQQAVADLADFLPPPTDAEVITFLSAQCKLLQKLYEDKTAQLAEANARAEKAEAEFSARVFWTDEHIHKFMDMVREQMPDGTRVVISHGYDELEGKVGMVLGAMHFIEQAAAKMAVDFGDGTEYVPSNLLRVVTSAATTMRSAQEAK